MQAFAPDKEGQWQRVLSPAPSALEKDLVLATLLEQPLQAPGAADAQPAEQACRRTLSCGRSRASSAYAKEGRGMHHWQPRRLALGAALSCSTVVAHVVLRNTVVPFCAQADLIPQLSGVLMMQPLARTATNAAYCASASGDTTSEAYRVQLQTRDGEAIRGLDRLLC